MSTEISKESKCSSFVLCVLVYYANDTKERESMAKRLFISHSWSYDQNYQSMVKLLDNRPYFDWTNYSVPSEKAFGPMANYKMREALQRQIRPAQCVIIIGGMWTSYSDWIQFEMDFAAEIGKPILGVKPWGAQRMPGAVTLKADRVVNWNSESIVEGIRAIS
jgi:hypothetical protein